MGKRYRNNRTNKNKPVSQGEWDRLLDDVTLREAYTTFAKEVQLSQHLAEERSRLSGKPVESLLDLRNAGKVLDQYPQLVRYLDGMRDREALRQEAMTKPDLALASPTGAIRGDSSGMLGGWAGSGVSKNQPIGVHNVRQLRDWSDHDELVSAAKAFLCGKVSRADIAVMPLDERKPYNRKAMKAIELLLDQPNEFRDTWPNLMYQYTNDYLTIGQATITKNMTLKSRLPVALYAEDAANIKIYPAWSGDQDEPRYLFEEGSYGMMANKKPLRNDEVIIAFCNPATYRFGLGPVQILADTIEADLRATAAALRMVEQKPPGSVVSLPGWSQQAISKLRSDYETEISGRRELLFLGGTNPAHVFPLVFSPRDNQFLEYQEWLARKVCTVFQISPLDLNLTRDINRSTASAEQEVSDSKGFIPLLLAHETCFNVELLADFAPKLPFGRFDLSALNLRIVFPEVSEAERMLHAEKMIGLAQAGLAGLPSFTMNQLLMLRGEEPVQGGNTFWVMTTNGPLPWLSYDGDYGDYTVPVQRGGETGAQDAAGGPAADDTSDDDFAGGEDTSTGAQDAAGGPTSSSAGSGSADTGTNSSEKRYKPTTKAKEEQTGVMVAFFLDTQSAKALALSDGEPPEDLHVTLCFLGEKSDYEQGFSKLKKALAGFASEAMPLSGNVSGLARFAPSPSSDGKAPVIALVNVKGIQQFRETLASRIRGAGYTVADDFEYTPHITLAYVDADDPMPVDDVPDVELTFDQLMLAVGDERSSFKMGDEQYPKYWEDRGQEKKTYRPQWDTRRPGKHWTPSAQLVIT